MDELSLIYMAKYHKSQICVALKPIVDKEYKGQRNLKVKKKKKLEKKWVTCQSLWSYPSRETDRRALGAVCTKETP